MLRKVGKAIWGLPGNIHFWWTIGIPGVTAALVWLIAFARETPLWQMMLVVIGTYLLLLVATAVVLRRAAPQEQALATEPEAEHTVSEPHAAASEPPLSEPQLAANRADDEELKQRSLNLSKELFRFSTERDNQDPTRTTWLPQEDISGDDPESKQRLSEHSQKGMNHFYETMDLYDQRFAGPVMALFDALESRKWVKPKEREKFQPDSPSAVRDVARRLSTIGNRLDKSIDRPDDEVSKAENEQSKGEVGPPEEKAPSKEERHSRYEDLKRRCRELADELRQFLEDHKSKGSNEEEIMRLYRRRLGDKASALLEELEEQGLYPPGHLKSFELDANAYPRSPMAINRLANTLGTIGHKR